MSARTFCFSACCLACFFLISCEGLSAPESSSDGTATNTSGSGIAGIVLAGNYSANGASSSTAGDAGAAQDISFTVDADGNLTGGLVRMKIPLVSDNEKTETRSFSFIGGVRSLNFSASQSNATVLISFGSASTTDFSAYAFMTIKGDSTVVDGTYRAVYSAGAGGDTLQANN